MKSYSGGGSSGGRSSSGSSKTSSSGSLSSNGQRLLSQLQGANNVDGAARAAVIAGAKMNLMAAYNTNQISDDDLRIISSKLGLD